MSDTITNEQIKERYRQIDAVDNQTDETLLKAIRQDAFAFKAYNAGRAQAEKNVDQIAASAVKILVKELGVLKTENEEMRSFLMRLGFEERQWRSSYPSQNSECPRLEIDHDLELKAHYVGVKMGLVNPKAPPPLPRRTEVTRYVD